MGKAITWRVLAPIAIHIHCWLTCFRTKLLMPSAATARRWKDERMRRTTLCADDHVIVSEELATLLALTWRKAVFGQRHAARGLSSAGTGR
jgi:hypothetical protein